MPEPMTSPLLELAERCERAAGPDLDLDHAIHDLVGDNDGAPLYTRSLDAAMALVPINMEWVVGFEDGAPFAHVHRSDQFGGIIDAATPALALCAASLKALARVQEGDEA